MKNYDELTNDLLERRDRYVADQKKKRKKVMGVATLLCCFCLAALVGFGVRQGGMSDTTPPDQTVEDALYPGIKDNFDESKGESPDNSANAFCHFWWNHLSVGGPLKNAIEHNPESVFAIRATYRPTTGNITSFTYEGKTLAELALAAEDERMLPEKMLQLLKEGDSLKYGTALYETGTPSGEKWAKSLYEEKIAFYGEELLGKYIVDGEFLRETLEKDIADFNENSARNRYELAYNAYLETVLPPAVSRLNENGIQCERAPYMNNAMIFFATAEKLKSLPLEGLEYWTFDLASDDLKGASNNVTDAAGLQIVN